MLLAEKIADKGQKTNYAQITVQNFVETAQNLCANHVSTEKTSRPLFKFEVSEKIAILDFDTYKFFVGEKLFTENNQVINRARAIFGNSVVFEAISPNQGVKIAVKFNDDATREELISLLSALFSVDYFDAKGTGFSTNCFLPALFIRLNSAYVPFQLPKIAAPQPQSAPQPQVRKANFSLAEIAAKYPQTSSEANSSVNNFGLIAYRNGYDLSDAIAYAQSYYGGSQIAKRVQTAYEFAEKTAAPQKNYCEAVPFLKSEKTAQIAQKTFEYQFETQDDFARVAGGIMRNFVISKNKYAAIQAPTGTGKTYLFTDGLDNFFRGNGYTVLFLVPTQSIAAQQNGIFGTISDADIQSERGIMEKGGTVLMTYDKARLLLPYVRSEKTLVVIDECHDFANCESYRADAFRSVLSVANAASKVLYLSATLPKTFLELQVSETIETHVFKPKKAIEKKISLCRYTSNLEQLFVEKLLPLCEKNKAAGVVTAAQIDNKEQIKYAKTLLEERGFSVSAIYDHVDLEVEDNYQNILQGENKVKTDVLLCTKKINAGVNLRNDAMHMIYISDLADKQGTNEFDVLQFFGRGRNVSKNPKNFAFEIWERVAKNPSEKNPMTNAQKVAFLDSQKLTMRAANRQIFAGIMQTFNAYDYNHHGGFFNNCYSLNEKSNRYELSYTRIAMYYDADTRRNTDFCSRLTEIDNSYSFSEIETFAAEKPKVTTETRAEKNAREIAEITHILETDLCSTDKIRRVAKLSKNKQVRAYFGGYFAPCEIENISGAELLLIFAAKLLAVGFEEKTAFEKIKGKTYSEIETYVCDAENANRYYTDAKNAIEKSEKRFLEKIITAVGKFENATLQELKKEIRKEFAGNNDYYGLQLHKLDAEKLRTICGFYFEISYSRKTASYSIARRSEFAAPQTEQVTEPQTEPQSEPQPQPQSAPQSAPQSERYLPVHNPNAICPF